MTNPRSHYAATLPAAGHPSATHIAAQIDCLGQQLERAATAFHHLSAAQEFEEDSFGDAEGVYLDARIAYLSALAAATGQTRDELERRVCC